MAPGPATPIVLAAEIASHMADLQPVPPVQASGSASNATTSGTPGALDGRAAHAAAGTKAAQPDVAGVTRIADAAALRVTRGERAGNAALIDLDHPKLGRLQLEIRMDGQQMTVRAIATTASSAIAIRASEAALRVSVQKHGVELKELRVDVRPTH